MLYNSQKYSSDFKEYLLNSQHKIATIDLSDKDLDYVIDKYCSYHSRRAPNVFRAYKSLVLTLHLIENKYQCTINPCQVTDMFWPHFISFSQERGLALSTISTTISQLKSVLKWASRYKADVSPTYDVVRPLSYSNQQIALSLSDVSRIYYFDINTIPRRRQTKRKLEKIRDMFVLSCCLGQRYSDMVRISKLHFHNNIFKILQQKTGEYAVVNIDDMSIDKKIVYEILNKYDYTSPYKNSLSAYNVGLKELFKYAGFDDEVIRESKIDGEIQTTSCRRYELIGSHTARRTFITSNIIRNKSISSVMRASGHQSYSSFKKYLCYDD